MPNIPAFVMVTALLVITPGSDTMLVVRSVISHGTRAGLLTVAGITAGCLVHAALSAAGLSAILATSARAFHLLRIAGAFYLVILGLQEIWMAATRSGAREIRGGDGPLAAALGQPFRDGLMTNVLNPKVAVFYLAFVPQFIESGNGVSGSYLILAGIHILLGAVWLSTLTFLLSRSRSRIRGESSKRALRGLTGAVLVGLGARLAVTGR